MVGVDKRDDVVGGTGNTEAFQLCAPPGGVAVAKRDQFAGLTRPLDGERPDRLQQSVRRRAVGIVGEDEALVDQPADGVEHCDRLDVTRRGHHRLSRLQRERPSERSETTQNPSFDIVEQLVAPFDRCQQRLLPRHNHPRSAGQEPEPIVQLAGDLFAAEVPTAGRGQLDRQRNPAQAMAHLSDRRRVRLVHGERRPGPPCPVNEQVDGVVLRQRLDRQPAVTRGRWQRRHPPRHLTGHAELLTAGRQHRHLRTHGEHPDHELGALGDQVLAIVEDDQRPARVAELDSGHLRRRHPRRLRQAQRLERRPADRTSRACRRQLNEPHAARERGHQLGAHRQSQASLANTSRPGQRHHPLVTEHVHQLSDLHSPADQRRQLQRQVLPERVQRHQRRKPHLQIRVRQLPHPLRAPEILQPVTSEIDQVGASRQIVDHQRSRHVRQQHLPAVTARPQPGTADDRQPEIVALVTQLRLTGVQRHPDRQPTTVRPWLRAQRTLGCQRRCDGVGRPAERGDDTVALALLHRADPAMGGDRLVEQLVVARHRDCNRPRLPLPGASRALDVSHQERHRPCWQHETSPRPTTIHLVYEQRCEHPRHDSLAHRTHSERRRRREHPPSGRYVPRRVQPHRTKRPNDSTESRAGPFPPSRPLLTTQSGVTVALTGHALPALGGCAAGGVGLRGEGAVQRIVRASGHDIGREVGLDVLVEP